MNGVCCTPVVMTTAKSFLTLATHNLRPSIYDVWLIHQTVESLMKEILKCVIWIKQNGCMWCSYLATIYWSPWRANSLQIKANCKFFVSCVYIRELNNSLGAMAIKMFYCASYTMTFQITDRPYTVKNTVKSYKFLFNYLESRTWRIIFWQITPQIRKSRQLDLCPTIYWRTEIVSSADGYCRILILNWFGVI